MKILFLIFQNGSFYAIFPLFSAYRPAKTGKKWLLFGIKIGSYWCFWCKLCLEPCDLPQNWTFLFSLLVSALPYSRYRIYNIEAIHFMRIWVFRTLDHHRISVHNCTIFLFLRLLFRIFIPLHCHKSYPIRIHRRFSFLPVYRFLHKDSKFQSLGHFMVVNHCF